MNEIAAALFLIACVVNLIPVTGAFSAGRLESLYGVQVRDANLLVLLQHRGVLLGIVGLLLIAAGLYPSLRSVGLIVGLISMASFIALARWIGRTNDLLRRVVVVDIAASLLLILAAALDLAE